MYHRLLHKPLQNSNSFFLFGPRGTGKTTWLKNNVIDSTYIDLLDSSYYQDLYAQPNRLEGMISSHKHKWVIIDEIQRIPDLLNEVHRLIQKGYLFILTGSSARSLRKKGVNLLAGRALTYHFHPLTSIELKDDFNLTQSLKFGHLPEVYSTSSPNIFLKTYVQTYLREEVLQEGLTRNLGHFTRFLEIASFSQGNVLNVAPMAREIGVDRITVENYFDILEDLLIGIRIPVFLKRAKRRMIKHRKFYFFDAGVYKSIRPMGPLDTPEEAEGAALETLWLQEIRALNDYFEWEYDIFFWRTSEGAEVDFVLYGPRGLVGIEIKRSQRILSSHLKGLKQFKKDYPISKCFCFYGGNRKEMMSDITLIPHNEAFKSLKNFL